MTASIVWLMNACFDTFLPTFYLVIYCDCWCIYCEAPADKAVVSSPTAQIWVMPVSSQLKVRWAPQKCLLQEATTSGPKPSFQTRHRLFCASGSTLSTVRCYKLWFLPVFNPRRVWWMKPLITTTMIHILLGASICFPWVKPVCN